MRTCGGRCKAHYPLPGSLPCSLAAKSFNPTSDLAALERWFGVLAQVGVLCVCCVLCLLDA